MVRLELFGPNRELLDFDDELGKTCLCKLERVPQWIPKCIWGWMIWMIW